MRTSSLSSSLEASRARLAVLVAAGELAADSNGPDSLRAQMVHFELAVEEVVAEVLGLLVSRYRKALVGEAEGL